MELSKNVIAIFVLCICLREGFHPLMGSQALKFIPMLTGTLLVHYFILFARLIMYARVSNILIT